ncbi:MAG: hypothetical protein JWL76_1578 [Thermoleophilia bacterium]|nr:hypothetical protein [Thermoleophilia bacterium]
MADTVTLSEQVEELEARIATLEARIQALEAGASPSRRSGSSGSGSSAALEVDAREWTTPYAIAELEVAETWIELHETSARPQLQRLIRQVVEEEGPITERLVLDRVRRAWGLKRAGGRVQEAFDQAVRQLVARALVERDDDALRLPGTSLVTVRVPTSEEATRRGAEDVPRVELALAMVRTAHAAGGSVAIDDLTMQVAKLFGWTRRGGAIQERLDAALELAAARGDVTIDARRVSAA